MPDDPATGPRPGDPRRRQFFRRFAGEVVTAATGVLGAAQVLQQQSAEVAGNLLAPVEAVVVAPVGYQAAFRWEDDVCRVVDQRHLPRSLVEREVRGAFDAAAVIREGAVAGGPAAAQVAAIGLVLTAARAHRSRAHARRATLQGSATTLRSAAPAWPAVGLAVDRIVARHDLLPLDLPGDEVAADLRLEAEAIVLEATEAHAAIASAGLAALPEPGERPLSILTIGATGAVASGRAGTAAGVIEAAYHSGRPLSVTVAETRPGLEGLRVTCWELVQAGVPARVVADAAAAHLVARGEVDVVLVGADRIAANGDVTAVAGTYPLAAVASRRGIPFFVCAPTSAIALDVAEGDVLAVVDRPPGELLVVGGTVVAPDGLGAVNPGQDVTPAGLVTAFVTEAGRLDPPYPGALAAAWQRADTGRVARMRPATPDLGVGDAVAGAGSADGHSGGDSPG
jgi:methylthioribose-1-phosphate isomerase